MDWLRQIPMGQFVDGREGWLRRLDARLKLAWSLVFLLTPVLAGPLWRVALVLGLGLALAVAAPACLLLARFWLHRTRNALANLTTNERLNRRRYAHFRSPNGALVNPFDRGAARNCIAFLCPAKPRTVSLLSAA